MNSDNLAAKSNNMMHHHVLEVGDVKKSIMVQGIDVKSTEGVEI
jgi:hypothetical protein